MDPSLITNRIVLILIILSNGVPGCRRQETNTIVSWDCEMNIDMFGSGWVQRP